MVALAPTAADATVATAKAADLVRARHRSDPRFAGWMPGAFDEQVVGLPEPPAPVGGGWWRVGTVLDGPGGDEELIVWLHPGERLIRLRRAVPPPPPTPPPTTGPTFEEQMRTCGRGGVGG